MFTLLIQNIIVGMLNPDHLFCVATVSMLFVLILEMDFNF